ncbi:hypothetical protein Mal52_52200 [Symmachiella dynata]|uniref:Uncharacterized protein n=1 Tax=Symmachiella dynata TaxID=2527995 RepID=A0A517ZW67_9PLAN|nr:hypothetical protein [Symmachiella dynata]QDU46698.1 hypothetical protein Mal52_52200 [Symmachiella dynata]
MNRAENSAAISIRVGGIYTVDICGKKTQAEAIFHSPKNPNFWYFEAVDSRLLFLVAIANVFDNASKPE